MTVVLLMGTLWLHNGGLHSSCDLGRMVETTRPGPAKDEVVTAYLPERLTKPGCPEGCVIWTDSNREKRQCIGGVWVPVARVPQGS